MVQLVVSAGMPRSGSTWLYNVARLALQARHGPDQVAAGWIGDRERLPKAPVVLLKLHDFDAALADAASVVLWSYRDLRDVLASQLRKFGTAPTLAGADRAIEQDRLWLPRAAHAMRYESMLDDPASEVLAVCHALGVEAVHAASVLHQAQALDYDSDGARNDRYNETTLYHRGHVTDGRHGSWQGQLPDDLVQAVSDRHSAWFKDRGYEAVRPRADDEPGAR